MKELYILDSCYNPTAAATNRILAFGNSLSKMGVEVSVYYLFPDKNCSKCSRYTGSINYVYLWESAFTKNKFYNTIRSLVRFYRTMKPEIPVYVYSLLNILYFLRLKKDIRLFHENTENPDITKWSNNTINKLLYKLYVRTVPKLDGLFLITSALRDKYITEFGAKSAKTYILNMIVDSNRFLNLPEITPDNVISYCGILSEFKDGVSILIKAFSKIIKTHSDYKLRLIGPFLNKDTEDKILFLVQKLGISEFIEFTGSVSPEEMPQLLKSSKILALARPYNIQAKYGFATKIGEYLMTGRPIVITRVGVIEQYLHDYENCIMAKPDDPDDFANKLLWTIENYDQAITIGKKGKLAALKYFDSTKEATKIYNIVNSSI